VQGWEKPGPRKARKTRKKTINLNDLIHPFIEKDFSLGFVRVFRAFRGQIIGSSFMECLRDSVPCARRKPEQP